VRLTVRRCSLALTRPLEASYGTVRRRTLLAVTLTDAAGAHGHGECAPLPDYEGAGLERVEAALRRHADALERSGEVRGAELLEQCRRADPLPAALAAVDVALWDRAGRLSDQPIAALLAEHPTSEVAVNALITAAEPSEAEEQAAAAARAGFGCVKVKVGAGDDARRISAVRAGAGAAMALRLDANGAWGVDEAARAIPELAGAGLELVEEPVHGLAGIRALRERVSARIAIDETAAEPGALASGAAHAVCLKLSRCGGISGLLAAAALVRTSGSQPYIASTLDGPVGVAAALHAAAALSEHEPLPHCGLATLGMFPGLADCLPVRAGRIAVPGHAGLGVDPL
jgi:L-alanine-DL-glutamate epimerase-like enolase superfamily enzyme